MSQGFWSLLKWVLLSFLILAYLSLRLNGVNWECNCRIISRFVFFICFDFKNHQKKHMKGMKSNLIWLSHPAAGAPLKSHITISKMMLGLDYNLSFKKKSSLFFKHILIFFGGCGNLIPSHFQHLPAKKPRTDVARQEPFQGWRQGKFPQSLGAHRRDQRPLGWLVWNVTGPRTMKKGRAWSGFGGFVLASYLGFKR